MFPDLSGEFTWDPENSSKEINFSSDCRHAFLSETNYYFRTITSNRPFFSGVHYWEIIADARTEHELKIGVTAQQTFNVNSSFSDYEFGFAYYGLGQLRHSDNSLGEPYGKFFKKKGVLGILLNMDLGTLSFALDGEFMGVAFEDKQLKKGPIWAAISLLHIGGLTLISGLEPPPYIPVNAKLNKKEKPSLSNIERL
jgi:E3 ubiquitin-protein ligase NRDP1